jgi:hypothetical protein
VAVDVVVVEHTIATAMAMAALVVRAVLDM